MNGPNSLATASAYVPIWGVMESGAVAKLTASTGVAEIACVLGSGILRLSVIVPAVRAAGAPLRAGPWTLFPCLGVLGDRGGVVR